MFKNKFQRKISIKLIIIFGLIIISSLSIYFLRKQINSINATIAEKKEMNYLIANREEVDAKISADFSSVDPQYEKKIADSIPSVYNILSFVDALESLSKKYSFKQTLSFNQPTLASEISGPISLMVINFNVAIDEINIDGLVNYLNDFEKLPYFVSINSLNYLAQGSNGWKENSSINISGRLYVHQ